MKQRDWGRRDECMGTLGYILTLDYTGQVRRTLSYRNCKITFFSERLAVLKFVENSQNSVDCLAEKDFVPCYRYFLSCRSFITAKWANFGKS